MAETDTEDLEALDGGDEVDEETLERRRIALGEVRQFGDPVLKSKASPVTDFGPELQREAERMIALMEGALGIGLAATQLGLMRRLLVFQAGPDAEPRAIVNPAVEWTSDDQVSAEEGCLSLADVIVDVERPLHARVDAVDLTGAPLTIEASGLEARVLQHEIDHLDGVLILDRTERPQRRAALRALRAGEHFDPGMLKAQEDEDEDEPGRE
ncbi:MAG TPA: peptide deformylase [Solirubrobacterales bacterium]|nr:peptide deformylase [Solirubrobacterales bacterium]